MSSGDALVEACRPEIEKFYALCDNGALEPIALMFRWLPRPRDTRPFSVCCLFPKIRTPSALLLVSQDSCRAPACRV